MSIFNPDQDSQTPDWTGASKGVKANTAAADLFGDLGSAAIAAVNIADQNNMTNIAGEVQREVDQVNDEWGTKASAFETNINGVNQQPLPEDLQRFGAHLGDVAKAYKNGTLKDSYYQSRIDSMSRQIRARYPGYREQIDTIIGQTLNRSTANDLRKSLMAQWSAEAADEKSQKDSFNQEVIAARKSGDLPPDWDIRNAKGNPYSEAETRVYMAASYNQKANIARQKSELELMDASSASTVKAATRTAQAELGETARKVYEGVLSIGDKTPAQIQQEINSGRVKPLAGEDLVAVSAKVLEMKSSLENGLWTQMNSPAYSMIPGDEKKKIVESSLQQFKILEDSLFNQQYGLLHMSKQLNDTVVQDLIRRWETENPMIGAVRAASQLAGGNEAMNMMIMSNSPMQNKVSDAVLSILSSDLFKVKPRGQNGLIQIFENGQAKTADQGGLTPDVLKATQKAAVRTFLDKNSSPEVSAQMAQKLFSEDNQAFLSSFKPQDRMPLFETMISPRITEKVKDLAKDNPQILFDYKNWITNSAVALFKRDVDTVNDQNRFGDYIAFEFDAEGLQFKAAPGKNMGAAGLQPLAIQAWESYKASESKKSVDNLNKYLRQLKPVLEEIGSDPTEEISELFKTMGVGQGEAQGSLYTRLKDALGALPEDGKPIARGGGRGGWEPGGPRNEGSADLKEFDLSKEISNVTNPKEPRGIRNNNPGNIEFGSFAKARGAKESDGRFAKFDTPEQGIQAMYDLLERYQSRGLDTVEDMISRWAPSSENDTGAYAKTVAKAMGIGTDEPFMFQGELAQKMINAMIQHENGKNPYVKAQK